MTKHNLRIFGVSPFSGRKNKTTTKNRQSLRRPAKRNRIALQKHFFFSMKTCHLSLWCDEGKQGRKRKQKKKARQTKQETKSIKASCLGRTVEIESSSNNPATQPLLALFAAWSRVCERARGFIVTQAR